MPRDLRDLIEQAVSSAPAEKHLAGDITRLAERAQRRRTAWVAAGAAAMVLVAAVAGYGLERDHATRPEPIGPWKYGQHHTLSEAVASATAPWFTTYDYPVPSALPATGGLGPVPEYLDVDAHGRLAALAAKRAGADGQGIAATYQVVEGPKGPVHPVPAPSPGRGGGVWDVSFTADDRLMWGGASGFEINAWITNLDGQNALAIRRNMDDVPGGRTVGGHPVVNTWFEGGRMWPTAVTKDRFPDGLQWVSLFSFDPAHPAVLRAEKPQDVLAIDVGGGTAVWLDGTTVRAEDLATGEVRTVPVPIDAGCHVLSADQFAGLQVPAYLSTDGGLISLVEQCQRSWHLVVTDLAGRLVADVDSGTDDYVIRPTLTGGLVVFAGGGYVKGAGPTHSYALDLRTGRFAVLGSPPRTGLNVVVTGAGRYVLWFDEAGGHVGRLSG